MPVTSGNKVWSNTRCLKFPAAHSRAKGLVSPTQTAVTSANPMSNTSSPSNMGSALTHAFPPTPSSATCPQAASRQRVPGMLSQCAGDNGVKAIPDQCAQAGLGHWEAGLLHGLSQVHLSSPSPLQDPAWTSGRKESLWNGSQAEDTGGL